MAKKRAITRDADPPKASADLQQAKLDALKELAYGASHEINNPLANIATRAQTLLKLESDPEKQRMLASIYAQAMRAHEMIADLMLFARPPALVRSRIDLIALLDQIVREMTADAEPLHAELVLAPSEAIALDADPVQLAVAIRAIVQNALEAFAGPGRIEISAALQGTLAEVVIRDNGPGIPDEALPHIFEPFYSGREAGRGLGFGLCKAWRIITDHGGKIAVEKNLPQGTVFRLRLPRVAESKIVP